MDSPQDVGGLTSPTIDTHAFQQYQQTTDIGNTFPSAIGSLSDSPLPTGHLPHIPTQMPAMYPPELDPTNALPISMQMHMSSLASPVDMSHMNVVSSALSDPAAAPGLLPDFPVQNASFTTDHRMNGIESIDPTHQLLSSPSATTPSTNPSHASSPALNGMASTYLIGSSSLASALDGSAVSRSRSGSSASPGLFTSTSPDLGFSSGGSGPPTSEHSLSFTPGYDSFAANTEDSSEVPGGAHLMVLGDMLKKIARTASSGSEACSNGQSTDAREIVDVLKKNVLLVAELVAAMQLGDGSDPTSSAPSPNSHANVAVSASGSPSSLISNGLEVGQQLLNPSPPSFTTPPSIPPEPNSMLDTSDMSRKRCASSVAGDRVVKTMKLEPQDDVSLQTQPLTTFHPQAQPTVLAPPLTSFPFGASTVISLAVPTQQAPLPPVVPSSVPLSRPSSPSRISQSGLSLLQDAQQQSNPPSLHSQLHYPHMDPSQAIPIPSCSFNAVSAAPNTMSTPIPVGFATAASMQNSTWPDARPAPSRHQHSHSGSSALGGIAHPGLTPPGPSTIPYPSAQSVFPPSSLPTVPSQQSLPSSGPLASVNSSAQATIRASRASSFSQSNPFAYTADVTPVPAPATVPAPASSKYESMQSRPSTSGLHSTRASSPDYDDVDGENDSDEYNASPQGLYYSPGESQSEDTKAGGDPSMEDIQSTSSQRRMSRTSPSADGGAAIHANEVPQEYRAEVERIFFEFLNKTCSNLDATDTKGEPIHQTLMAKKMQRLDESPDFRPFKFRIQAFTNAFLEELAQQGYPEEKIPMKKIRNFLWNQPYISRFNEEGKKSKSKGNHIWHVDAKKAEYGWVFRPFQRRLAGSPPGVAYVGLRWQWTPRIWDPQASRSNMPVTYSAKFLPSWLSWKDDVLSGIPPPDAQSCDITVEARFVQDGQEEVLTHTVHVSIAPMAAVDSSFASSRRPSLVGQDLHNPRRVLSDSILPQTTSPRPLRSQPSLNSAAPVVAPDSQVVQVLTTAAQRVAQEAQSQVVASPMDSGPELQALAKQQHVLTVTAQAFNNKSVNDSPDGTGTQSNALAAAAQLVVLQAARQVAADRTVAAASSGIPSDHAPAPQVTVKEVSVAMQSAVATAVEMVGPLSSEVDVLMTAKSLLQQQTMGTMNSAPPLTVDPAQMAAPLDPVRPHSTGTLLSSTSYSLQSNMAMSGVNGYYPHTS